MANKLKSDFSFGFELEGIYNTSMTSRDNVFDKLNEMLGGQGEMHYDGSINYKDNETSFEYASPVLKYTPSNIIKVLTCLDSLPKIGVRTNRSCGFHTHVSFDTMNVKDVLWFIFWLCATENYLTFKKLGRTNMFLRKYASFTVFEATAANIKGGYIDSAIKNICTNSKYRAFRVHPQGTLEWRGPRTFLNTPTHTRTLSFFKKLDKFINCFIESCKETSVTINGNIFTREEFERLSKPYIEMVTFKSCNKKSILEKMISNGDIINKMALKDLEKNKEDVIKALSYFNSSFGPSYTSKTLFNWLVKYDMTNYINKFFSVKTILSNSDKLYEKSRLFETLKQLSTYDNRKTKEVYDCVKQWHKDKKYKNAVKLYTNYILSIRNNPDPLLLVDCIRCGLFDTLDGDTKTEIVSSFIEYIKDDNYSKYNGFFTNYYANEELSKELLKHGYIEKELAF